MTERSTPNNSAIVFCANLAVSSLKNTSSFMALSEAV
jgi:hypothetical protein